MVSKSLDFCLKLSRAQAALVRRFDGALGGWHGLSFGDFTVLLHLSQSPEGRLRRVDLAERLGLTVSGVTRTLIPLEKIGLVSRVSDARDARVAYAVITEAGKQLLIDSLASAEQISSEFIAADTSQDLEELTKALVRISGGRG